MVGYWLYRVQYWDYRNVQGDEEMAPGITPSEWVVESSGYYIVVLHGYDDRRRVLHKSIS